jgi:hypothetical protein
MRGTLHSALIKGPLFPFYVVVARAAGKKLVLTIHVTPTDKHRLFRPYFWCIRKLANACVFINRTSENEFFKRYPSERRKIFSRIAHGSYPVRNITPVGRNALRACLAQEVIVCWSTFLVNFARTKI